MGYKKSPINFGLDPASLPMTFDLDNLVPLTLTLVTLTLTLTCKDVKDMMVLNVCAEFYLMKILPLPLTFEVTYTYKFLVVLYLRAKMQVPLYN